MTGAISVCGQDCSKCYCKERCAGCDACKGIVFHTGGAECAIWHCCVAVHGFSNCLACPDLPCGIWSKTRDPHFTDEEFEANVKGRIALLQALQGK